MADNYAPDGAEEDSKPRSKQASPRDLVIICGIILVIVLILRPVYLYYVDEGKQTRCASNLNNIYKAMQIYAVNENEHFPPTYYPDQNGEPVLVGPEKLPLTWASIIQPQMKTSDDFKCPKAEKSENSFSVPFVGKQNIELSYGMYTAMSLRAQTDISSPGGTILLTETSNSGALNTYNPQPLGNNDGFLIGYDSGNSPTVQAIKGAKFITRLAFPKTADKSFKLDGQSRHRVGIRAIYADGSLTDIKPDAAEVTRKSSYDDNIAGLWSTR